MVSPPLRYAIAYSVPRIDARSNLIQMGHVLTFKTRPWWSTSALPHRQPDGLLMYLNGNSLPLEERSDCTVQVNGHRTQDSRVLSNKHKYTVESNLTHRL